MNFYHLLDNLPSCNLHIHCRHSNVNFFLQHKVRDNFRSILNYLSMVMVMVMVMVMIVVLVMVMVMILVMVMVRV